MKLEKKEGVKPVSIAKIRRYTPEEVVAGAERVRELLAAYLIAPSSSEWSSHATFARKKDGSLRLCCNYVRLNRVTKGVEFPIPDLLDECEKFAGMNFYSRLDGMSGYYVIPIRNEDRELTSFVFDKEKWQWKRMSFGIKKDATECRDSSLRP